jgi:methenyltetrahydrofolate cyclohydrolase
MTARAANATIGSRTIGEFLDRLASDSPTPGGGAVAALAAAAGAALISMVAKLTIDKAGYEDAWEPMRAVARLADDVRPSLLELADRDAMAFEAVMTAFRMPKGTDEERESRSRAIQMAFAGAAAVPMEIAMRAGELLEPARDAIELGNVNAASDGASAAWMLLAAVECAAANVAINAGALKDEGEGERLRANAANIRQRAHTAHDAAHAAFDRRMA